MNTITKKNSNIYYQQHANKGARHYNRTQPKAPSALPWWKNSNYRICAATLAALGTLIVLSIYQRSGLVHLVNHLVEKNNKIGKIANGMIGKARNKIERELKNTLYIANLRPNGILQCPLDPIHHTAYYPAILFLTKNFHSLSDQHLKMENLFRTATAIRWAPLNFVNSDSIEKNPAETSPNAHNLKKRRISSLQPYCPKSTKSEGPAPYTLLPFERPLFRLRQSPGTNRSQKGVVLETNTPSSASDDPQKLSHDPQFTELKQPCYNSTVDTPNQTSLDEITSQENAMSTYHPGFEDKIISSYHTVRNFISNYWPNIIITAGIIFFFMARNRANRLHGAPGALGVFGGGINLANHGPENGQGGGINLANHGPENGQGGGLFNPNPYDEIALVPLNLLHLNQPQQQQQPVRHCALARMLQGVGLDEPANEDDVAIPEEWIVEREHRYYHLGNLLLNLLTQTAAQDPFDRQAYNEQALRLFAQRIGVDEDSFLNIWIFSSDISPETVPTHVHPDIQGRLRTDYRFYSLYRLLIDANNHFSNNMLNFLTTNDAWRPQIWAEEFPNFPYSQGTQLSPELQQMAQELDGQQGF